MNLRTRAIQSIVCSLCRTHAWHDSQQPVRVGLAWHHPNCVNVTGPVKLEVIDVPGVVQSLRRRRPRALR